MRSTLALLATFALTVPLTGCFFVQNGGTGGAGGSGGNTTQADVKQYDDLRAELDQHRSMFLKAGASDLTGIGSKLFWLEFPTYSPTLHAFDTTTNAVVNYGFSIGTADDYNFRASEDLVVRAEVTGGNIVYHAFAVGQANDELGSFALAPPSDEQKWWAYAPDHSDVYVVTTGAETKLLKWTVGQEAPTEVLTFEKIGIQVGEFWDFGVDQGKLVLIESGRIWSVDLATQKPTWLGNKTEADGAWWDAKGVLYESASGPFFFDYATQKTTDVGKAIERSDFEINKTFSTSHLYDGSSSPSLARLGQHVGYTAESGIFTYDLDAGEVRPMLLDARDDSMVYASPVFLDDGSVFVKGLVSSDGAIGADGPVYRVDFQFSSP
ncbi:MAG TPA: hypothetical protein VHB21_16740 [Minicystis sp.]|nr:hypothetical protein [Minicystis sp.]